MKVSLYSDYAFRVLLYLAANNGDKATIAVIAQYFDISHDHLRKVIHTLSKNSYIKTYLGRHGGIVLSKNPDEIRLDKVFFLFEKGEWIACEQKKCILMHRCSLQNVFGEAEKNFILTLAKYTLADLMSGTKL